MIFVPRIRGFTWCDVKSNPWVKLKKKSCTIDNVEIMRMLLISSIQLLLEKFVYY